MDAKERELGRSTLVAVGYAEMKGYKPIDLGFINIEVRNRRIKSVQKIKV